MKITHSIIVLTSIIFVAGSMLTVGLELKTKTDSISATVEEARLKHEQKVSEKPNEKNVLNSTNKGSEVQKAIYNLKLESLNQKNDTGIKNKGFLFRRTEKKTSID